MKKASLIVVLVVFSLVVRAQESRTNYNFLRLPVSAHAAALGGDNITIVEDDPTLTFHNPALLTSVSDRTLNLNYMTYMEGVTNLSASFNRTVGDKASWAVTAQLMDYGTMRETDASGVQSGDFSAKDIALGGTFSYILSEKIVGGITARFVSSSIGDYSSFAMGVDLGANYYDEERELSLSLVAKNLGGQLKSYDEVYGRMPFDLQAGVSKKFENLPFRVSATMVDLNHWDYKFINHVVAGVDLLLSDQFYLAAGYNFRRANEMKIVQSEEEESSHGAGLSFGGGLSLERFKLNVAYGKYHVSSTSLIINISYTL